MPFPMKEEPPRSPRYPANRGFSFERFYLENRRLFIWIILGLLLWQLRSFFSLIFLTFAFAFIAAPISDFFVRKARFPRRVAICAAFALLVTLLVSASTFIVPQVAREAMNLVSNLPKTEQRLLELRRTLVQRYPTVEPILMNYLRSTIPESILADLAAKSDESGTPAVSGGPATAVPSASEVGPLPPGGTADLVQMQTPGERELLRAAKEDEAVIHLFLGYQIKRLTNAAPGMIRAMWAGSGTILLALLFSFLISLDLLRLGEEVRNLRNSRLRDFYEETALPVVRFGYTVGRTIQAQAMIAMVNTLLTFIGLSLLGVPSLSVLSLIVFLCSFIPVLGVFISTIPIVLVAINSDGLNLAVLSVLMVIVVHAIEAYLLNPMIYGKHLKINPVIVLIILFIGHHAFGVWGMLLGVPVAHYFLHDVFGVPIWSARRLVRKKPGGPESSGDSAAASPDGADGNPPG
jgi:predicted PurR-regulated permease PerM